MGINRSVCHCFERFFTRQDDIIRISIMRIVMRIFSGVFMVTIGVGFSLAALESTASTMLQIGLVILGVSCVLFGVFVLTGRRERPKE